MVQMMVRDHVRGQAIIWNNADVLLTESLGTHLNKFEAKYINLNTQTRICKYCLQNGGHFVQDSVCKLEAAMLTLNNTSGSVWLGKISIPGLISP